MLQNCLIHFWNFHFFQLLVICLVILQIYMLLIYLPLITTEDLHAETYIVLSYLLRFLTLALLAETLRHPQGLLVWEGYDIIAEAVSTF